MVGSDGPAVKEDYERDGVAVESGVVPRKLALRTADAVDGVIVRLAGELGRPLET